MEAENMGKRDRWWRVCGEQSSVRGCVIVHCALFPVCLIVPHMVKQWTSSLGQCGAES